MQGERQPGGVRARSHALPGKSGFVAGAPARLRRLRSAQVRTSVAADEIYSPGVLPDALAFLRVMASNCKKPDQRARAASWFVPASSDDNLKHGKLELYQDLKRRILTLDLEPGTDLDETQLSKEYGISRTPLRDVFRHLAGEGFLAIENNRGASVSPLSHKTLRDFFLAAPMVYAAVSKLAARNAKSPQIEELHEAALQLSLIHI